MIDINDMLRRIAEGDRNGFYTSPVVKELLAELADLRQQRAEHLIDNRNAHEEGVDAGRDDERVAVVAWLRAECGSPGHEERFCAYCNVRRNIAADIERGEHRREEGA